MASTASNGSLAAYGDDEDEIITAVLKHKMVHTKTLTDGLVSANFSDEAFFKARWDDLSMLARGLFVEQVQTPRGRKWCVRGRSYHKFFYRDERGVSFMTRSQLPELLQFPLTCYIKENGYLGIVFGLPSVAGAPPELVAASKSTTAGPFAEHLRQMLVDHLATRQVTPAQLAAQLLADNVSLVFEVIDPVFDPHIIKYAHAKLILLDVIVNRIAHLSRWSYAEVTSLGASLGLPVKRVYTPLASMEEYDAFHERCLIDEDFMVDGRHVEGFVLEGQNGFMLKIKTAFYTNWKRFRTLKIPLVHNKPVHVGGSEARTVANALVWLSQPANRANAKEDVIRLRDLYWASIGRRPEPATDGDDNGEQGPLSTADLAPAQSPGLPSDSAVSAVPSDDGGTVHELSESKTSSFLGLVQRVHREVVEHKRWPVMGRVRRPPDQAWTVWAVVHALRQPSLFQSLGPADLIARWRAGAFPPIPASAPIVFVCVGLPGMGKSTFSARLGRLLGIPRLSQDDCGGKAPVFLARLQSLLAAHGAIIADRNNHDAARRQQVIDVAKSFNPATAIIALSFQIPTRAADVLPLLEARIMDRGQNHPTLTASSPVRAVLGSFSASFRPVRFWERTPAAIAHWPTGDRPDGDADVDYLVDENIAIDARPPAATVFESTLAVLRPLLAQFDRFAGVDLSAEAIEKSATLPEAATPPKGTPMTPGSGSAPRTPSPARSASRSSGRGGLATTNMFAALALDDENVAAAALDAVDEEDTDAEAAPDPARWSNGKGSPWSTMEPQLHRVVQPEHARAFRSGAVSRETLPRYYALQLLPKMVDVIAERLAATTAAASLSTYDSLAPMFTNDAPHVTLLYLAGPLQNDAGSGYQHNPQHLSPHNLALLRRLQADVGRPYTVLATHILQNEHCCCLATTVPPEWMDDRFGRAQFGNEAPPYPTHHITLALSHQRPAFYANMLVERAFWKPDETRKVLVIPLDPPLALAAAVAGCNA